jgi:hypothetical protein
LFFNIEKIIQRFQKKQPIDSFSLSIKKGSSKEIYSNSVDYFDLASITKSFVITAILKLDDEKILSINDKVSKYLKISGSFTENLEIQHLLNLTCSFNWKDDFDKDFLLSTGLKGIPGRKITYHNTQSIMLGWILEEITGKNLTDSLFEILGEYFYGFRWKKLGTPVPNAVQSSNKLKRGVVHDPVARRFMEKSETVGCAGAFGRTCDIENFLRFFSTEQGLRIYKKIINNKNIPNESNWQLGFIVRKEPYIKKSSFGVNTIMMQGFTGCYYSVNPVEKFSAIILTNYLLKNNNSCSLQKFIYMLRWMLISNFIKKYSF